MGSILPAWAHYRPTTGQVSMETGSLIGIISNVLPPSFLPVRTATQTHGDAVCRSSSECVSRSINNKMRSLFSTSNFTVKKVSCYRCTRDVFHQSFSLRFALTVNYEGLIRRSALLLLKTRLRQMFPPKPLHRLLIGACSCLRIHFSSSLCADFHAD